jgi:tetratricopeptide (TPR) repeat protein
MFPAQFHWLIAGLMFFFSVSSNARTENELQCGALENAFGPFDYRTAPKNQKQLVEGAHFTNEVEQLIRGTTAAEPVGDLDYTLRAFPNHPRALRSLMEWGFRKKTDRPYRTHWPIWCYFDRAIRFQPDDAQVKMLYAVYLQRQGKFSAAAAQLEEAQKLVSDNANIHYNMGLVYLDLKEYEKSLDHAHRAYSLGFPLEGLRNRLTRAGKWREALPATKELEAKPQAASETPAGEARDEK